MSDLPQRPKSKRGFASMSPEKSREIRSMGGKAVSAEKRAFSQDKILASEAANKRHGNTDE